MEKKLNLYLNELKKKNAILQDLFKYVSEKNFKITEDTAEVIPIYLSKKEQFLKELLKIENNIKVLNLTKFEMEDKSVLEIVNQNDTLIKKIINFDEINKDKISKILVLLKNNIKLIKNTEKANLNYYNSLAVFSEGNYFDSKS